MEFAPARWKGEPAVRRPESRRVAARRADARPAAGMRLQRCACGGSCPRCQASAAHPPLTINTPGDAFEREADAAADAVMSTSPASASISPAPPALRRCACGGSCPACRKEMEETLRRDDAGGGGAPVFAPPAVHDVLASPGRPLAASTRSFMEDRFGADFSAVRVHDDARAAESARAVDAHAYTVGSSLVFASGRYAPGTPRGDRLLAHELAHVVQQSGGGDGVLRRQHHDIDPMDDPRMHPSGAPGAVSCTPPAHCPAHFCQPYSSASYATHQRTKMLPILMAGIAAFVDSRVVSLWHDHLLGGTATQDLTSTFAADFTLSRTTAATTDFLVRAMKASLIATPPAFPPGVMAITEDFSTRLATELAALDDPTSPDQMNFNIPKEVPGNLAGGIGKDQTSCKAGAKPSPFNDERTAKVTAKIFNLGGGKLLVLPYIAYTVRDTVDVCPGDCGTSLEQVATVPISQFEATGISGDVPYKVEFPAPALSTFPFLVP